MPAGRSQGLLVGLCRRHGRAVGLRVPTHSSGLLVAHSSTFSFHFPVETGNSDTRSSGRDGRRTCRSAGPSDDPSVCAVGMAGHLGSGHPCQWVDPPGASTCNEHAAFSSGCGPYLVRMIHGKKARTIQKDGTLQRVQVGGLGPAPTAGHP